MSLGVYLPQDRLRALADGRELPTCTSGSALLADIAGFTSLTETLREAYGTRRGAEEITRRLDEVHAALIRQVERWDGSVVGFAGDAVLCWFDDRQARAPLRALRCAGAMQRAMQAFADMPVTHGRHASLGLKVAIATGPASRWVVGDPLLQRLDVLTGPTVGRAAIGERMCAAGEIVIDDGTLAATTDAMIKVTLRVHEQSGTRLAAIVLQEDAEAVPPSSASARHEGKAAGAASKDALSAWMHPAVVTRERADLPGFSSEFRPCCAVFVGLGVVDDRRPESAQRFDELVTLLQRLAHRRGGALMDIATGDHGCYAYINFGAFATHEDDTRRALTMTLELRDAVRALADAAEPPIGLARGLMRVGSFGGPTRRAFGALGDDVNLAARLMQTAAPGEILLAPQVQRAAAQHFRFEPRPPLPMRGKQEPLPVFALIGAASVRPLRLQEPDHPLPMIGRHDELQMITEALKHARDGHVEAVLVVGEAGIGKSRLLIEAIRAALRLGFACYAGECQSDGIHTAYLPWKPVWSALFGVDPMAPLRRNLRALGQEIAERAAPRFQALPLLARMLGMTDVDENDFTRTLPPAARRDVLAALLVDCLKHAAHEEPLLIVLEDIHWIDPLSLDLLDRLFRSATGLRVCFLVSSRRLAAESPVEERLAGWPAVRRTELSELDRAECTQAIRAKLAQLYPDREGSPPGVLIDRLVARSQGNPFYLEELLNYLRDRGLDPRMPEHIARIELPESLHALVLSRIDQLSPDEQATLRAASVVGRSFPARWVAGYCPELGDLTVLEARLDRLHAADITTVEAPEDLRYQFKHVVAHEATYQSLPYSTRSALHGRLAAYLESALEDAPPLDTLAYHYARSGDTGKQREYLRKAGDAARREYANTTALAHYTQLLPLLDEPTESIEVLRLCVEIRELMGDFNPAEQDALQALAIARSAGDNPSVVRMKTLLGRLCRHRGDSDAAFDWLAQARATATDPAERARAMAEEGIAHHRRGEFNAARECLNQSLADARRAGDDAEAARSLNYLGLVATSVGDKEGANALFQESIALRLASGDRWSIANSLNNLGNLALDRSDFDGARTLYEKSLALKREIGDRWGVSASVGNLGLIALMKGDHAAARTLLEDSLALSRELGDRWTEACMLGNLGKLQCDLGQTVAARRLLSGSLELSRSINDGWGIAASLCDLGRVALVEGDLDTARQLLTDSFDRGQQMGEKQVSSNALMLLGLAELQRGSECDLAAARAWILDSLRIRLETGERVPLASSLVCAAALAQRQGQPETASMLLGAVDAALAALRVPVESEARSWHARTLADAREAMGPAAFDAACASGAAMSLEDATRLADAALSPR